MKTVDQIRSHFPSLERIHRGLPVAYFDAPGGTQVPRQVASAVTDYLFHHNANTHWAYPTSVETDEIIWRGREAAAELLNCSPREISFGANMTTITFHLSRALGRTWKAGDEVIVTELDHHGNVGPWRALEVDRGIVTRTTRMNVETAQLDFDHLQQLVGSRTRLIAIGAASNSVGTISNLERARDIARAAGALLFVDAVHLAPHELIDVQRIGCDLLACSAYKFYGPHMGLLFTRESLLTELPIPKLDPSPNTAPERAETGTQNQEGIAGMTAAIDFLAAIGGEQGSRRERLARAFSVLHDRGAPQTKMLWDALSSLRRVRLFGPPPSQPRTPTVSFTIDGVTSTAVSLALAEKGLFASHGDFYAATVIERFGLGEEGLVRIGCACYTTDGEVERLIAEIERIAV